MKLLIQEIKDVLKKPRLVLQYLVLNFFLISVGLAAVVYIKKQNIVEHQQTQNQATLGVIKKLDKLDLPPAVEKDVKELKESAKLPVDTLKPLPGEGSDPKDGGDSAK